MRSPLRTAHDVAVYIRHCDPVTDEVSAQDMKATRHWIGKYIPKEKRKYCGRSVRVHIDDVDAALSRKHQRSK
ncbi:MAG: hypothetical protein ABI652_04065 [Acidobacteriota bacterium]